MMPTPKPGDLLTSYREVTATKQLPIVMKRRSMYGDIDATSFQTIEITYEKDTSFLVVDVFTRSTSWVDFKVMDPNDMSIVTFRAKRNGQTPTGFNVHPYRERKHERNKDVQEA